MPNIIHQATRQDAAPAPGVRVVAAGTCLPPRGGGDAEALVAVDMALEASRAALTKARRRIDEIDVIITKSLSPSHLVADREIVGPRLGHPLQRGLGATGAFVFDLLDADWCVALDVARGFMGGFGARNVLVVHAEAGRVGVAPDARSGFTLIDGAGALVLTASEDERERRQRSLFRALGAETAALRIEVMDRAAMVAGSGHRAQARFAPGPALATDVRRVAALVAEELAREQGEAASGHTLLEAWFDEAALGAGSAGGRRATSDAVLGPFTLPHGISALEEPTELTLFTLDLVKWRMGARRVTAGAR